MGRIKAFWGSFGSFCLIGWRVAVLGLISSFVLLWDWIASEFEFEYGHQNLYSARNDSG